MAIYRFKIVWEENEEVERIILIKSNQTFEDFFHAITDAFELTNKDVSASFFTSDDYWDKHVEITLKKEDIQGDEKLMTHTKVASFVEQPRQRFVFMYDAQLQLTFLIELIKIEPDKNAKTNDTFPQLIFSKNKIPKRRKTLQTKTIDNSSIIPTNTINDDEIDKMIYNNLMNMNLSEEDILSGKLDDLWQDKNASHKSDHLITEQTEDEEDEETDSIFDENDDIFDNDDMNEEGYYGMNDEYEN